MCNNKILLVLLLLILVFTSLPAKEILDDITIPAEEIKDDITIGRIVFSGNEQIDDNLLNSTIFSRSGDIFDQKKLNEDTARISKLYQTKGILHVKVFLPEIKTTNSRQIDVVFRIEELTELQIRKIHISGNRYISSNKIEQIIPATISLINLNSIINSIVKFYNENGFLFAAAELDSLSLQHNNLIAFCTIEEGNFCEFEEFKFRGNAVTKENTLIKISGLQSSEKITADIMNQATENLRKKQYIKDCSIIPLNSKQLLFEIEEDKMSLFSGIMGYDNSQKKNEKITGFANVEFLNLYGTDRSLTFLWQSLNASRTSIEMSYHESGPAQIPLSADISVSRLEADSTYIQTTLATEIYYYNLRNRYGGYFAFEDVFPGSRRPRLIEKTSYQKIGAFWKYSNLDFYQNPTRGTEFDIKFYYIFNEVDKKNVSKQAIEAGFCVYKQILPRIVFTSDINANIFENKELSSLEIFYLGGSKNLRGFTEDQFSGFRVGWINNEMRYLLSRSSRVFVFTDYGYVESKETTLGKLFGFGFGLRLKTRLGILAMDYGFSYNGAEFRNPLDGIIHFGLESKL